MRVLRDRYSAEGEYGVPYSPSALCARPFGRARARMPHELRSGECKDDRQRVGTRCVADAREVIQPAGAEENRRRSAIARGRAGGEGHVTARQSCEGAVGRGRPGKIANGLNTAVSAEVAPVRAVL